MANAEAANPSTNLTADTADPRQKGHQDAKASPELIELNCQQSLAAQEDGATTMDTPCSSNDKRKHHQVKLTVEWYNEALLDGELSPPQYTNTRKLQTSSLSGWHWV